MREAIQLVSLFLVISSITANEMSRCCSGGARHFLQTDTCSNLKSEGTSITCVRSAGICCLRALLDSACDDGAQMAKQDEVCPVNINELGGGLRKECCDCCLLAKDLIRRNEPCIPPTGFSAACLKAFSKCCSNQFEVTQALGDGDLITGKPLESTIMRFGDRCSSAKCEHLCNDRGGESVDCSCRTGYDLASDGYSCVDVDECMTLIDDCLESQRCFNTPGSYKCIRTLSCGTGYAMDSETEACIDVDECNLGSHDCGVLYQCRNTQGSYRCDPKRCGDGELQNPRTGECTSIECPKGYYPKNGTCNDIDECSTKDRCMAGQECVNTPGSYRCQTKGDICTYGYAVNPATGFCEDIDECLLRTSCGSLECVNMPGSFKCKCPEGYEFDEYTKRCEDIDECLKFAGHVCDLSAECQNTIGSFVCKCNAGFRLAVDGRRCEDINECSEGIARCDQKCVNIPGSYQCICDRGYVVSADGNTCEDIDECSVFAGSGGELCMGGCINTRGSYLCQCPPGYKIQQDGRTCTDVDECALGECQGSGRVCVNTLGHYKCHRIECPPNYLYDSNYKNGRCVRNHTICAIIGEESCSKKYPVQVTFQYIAIPKEVIINSQRPTITLFTIKGPSSVHSVVQFELVLKSAVPESPHVIPATRPNFLLQKGDARNSAVIAIRDSLDGPQTVHLDLVLRLTKSGTFAGKYLAKLVVHVAAYKKHANVTFV